jgi:hypothetical protein
MMTGMKTLQSIPRFSNHVARERCCSGSPMKPKLHFKDVLKILLKVMRTELNQPLIKLASLPKQKLKE